jgi:hypothetical protein
MIAAAVPHVTLTAADLMSRDVVSVSQDMALGAAAELFCRQQLGEAAVVDADGRCVGILSATDLIRASLPRSRGAEDLPLPACPYQARGRLVTGADTLICTRTQGSCPLQQLQPLMGGRHTAICRLRDELVNDWQQLAGGCPPA